MKQNQFFLSENFQFLEVKFSIYMNRRVFLMLSSLQLVLVPQIVHYIVFNIFWPFMITEPIQKFLKTIRGSLMRPCCPKLAILAQIN